MSDSAAYGPPRPIRFEERFGYVRALQYDGTPASAAALAAAFPGRFAWSVEREGVLLALAVKPCSFDQLHEMTPGSWFVEVDRWHDFYVVMSRESFPRFYSPACHQGDA